MFPQLPQLFASVLRLTSQPFAALPSQFAKPVLHVRTWQAPLTQTELACAREQIVPHVPQLFGSYWVFTQLPAQLTSGDWQVTWHVPATQMEPAGQIRPQPPQLFSSTCVSTHTPPQFVRPAWHET